MKSTPAHIVITGRVKGAPKIKQDGSAVLVVKTLDEATVEEKFPKRRVRGKQKQIKQLIPAEDALRMAEDAAHCAAAAERTAGDRRVQGLHELANQAMDQQAAKLSKEQARTRHQKGKTAAAKQALTAARAAAKIRELALGRRIPIAPDEEGAVRSTRPSRAATRNTRDLPSFADTIAQSVNA